MYTLFTIFIVLAILLILSFCLFEHTNEQFMVVIAGAAIGFFIAATITMIFDLCTDDDIPAIEVYRGNTTLEITYKDNIPIDSVVVYKNK